MIDKIQADGQQSNTKSHFPSFSLLLISLTSKFTASLKRAMRLRVWENVKARNARIMTGRPRTPIEVRDIWSRIVAVTDFDSIFQSSAALTIIEREPYKIMIRNAFVDRGARSVRALGERKRRNKEKLNSHHFNWTLDCFNISLQLQPDVCDFLDSSPPRPTTRRWLDHVKVKRSKKRATNKNVIEWIATKANLILFTIIKVVVSL